MIIFKFLRFILLFFVVFFITLFFSILYIGKNYLTTNNIKSYIIEEFYEKTGFLIFIDEIKFNKANMVLNNIILREPRSHREILKAKTIELNINIFNLIKNFSFNLDSIIIKDANLQLYKKNNRWNFENIFAQTTNKHRLPDLIIKNLSMDINNLDLKEFRRLVIKEADISQNFFSRDVDINAELEYETDILKQIFITTRLITSTSFEKLEIRKLNAKIKDREVEITGVIPDLKNPSVKLSVKTFDKINIKDFLKINKNIFVDKFNATLNTKKVGNDRINIYSYIKELGTNLSINYNIKSKKIEDFEITAKGVDVKKFKEFVDPFMKDYEGKCDLKINLKGNKLLLTATSDDLSFKDIYEMLSFKQTRMKFSITHPHQSLDILDTKANFPLGNIKGSLHQKSDHLNEDIKAKFKLDDIDIEMDVNIKDKFKNRRFIININTSKLPFEKFLGIYKYAMDKINQKPINYDSPYNMIKRKVVILWDSPHLLLKPYITADKVIMKSNIERFDSFENITGNFKIKILNGLMDNIPKNMQENEKYNLIFMPITRIFYLNRMGALKVNSQLKTIEIYEMGVDFDLNNGKIIINKFYLNSKEFLIYAKGEVDIKNERIDMKSYIINRKDYKSGVLPETLTDAKGRPAIAFKIKGSFKNNELNIIDATNITDIVEKEVKNPIEIK